MARPKLRWHVGAITAAALFLPAGLALAADQPKPVTFSKDVAPIFQAKCQSCHEPGSIAPMSLITFQDVRPWAKSIRARVSARQMPPWHIDRSVGVQTFKNDMSLTDEQVNTIVNWVDKGAAQGNPAAAAGVDDRVNRRPQLMEWAIGKGYDRYPDGTGKLILPGEKISWDQHIHAAGEEVTAGSELGIWLYPKGQEPKIRTSTSTG